MLNEREKGGVMILADVRGIFKSFFFFFLNVPSEPETILDY